MSFSWARPAPTPQTLNAGGPRLLGALNVGADSPVLPLICSERQALEPVCITLGDQQTLWALDVHGHLWFRTGIVAKKPQGDDDHWWQVGARLWSRAGLSLLWRPAPPVVAPSFP